MLTEANLQSILQDDLQSTIERINAVLKGENVDAL